MALGNKFLEVNKDGLGIQNEKINSASVDLAIGDKLTLVTFDGYKPKSSIRKLNNADVYQSMLVDAKEYEPRIRYTEVDLNQFPEGLWIRPGVGVLCATEANLKIPKDVVGQVLLKSSRGREFYQSCMAGYFDNGFEGQGTLEIYAPVIPIFFEKGLKIVQMRYDALNEFDTTYAEQLDQHYMNQTGPTPSAVAKF